MYRTNISNRYITRRTTPRVNRPPGTSRAPPRAGGLTVRATRSGVNPEPPPRPPAPEERDVLPPPKDPLYPREILGGPAVPRERSPGPAGRAASTAGLVFDSWRRRPGPRRA